MGIGPRDNAAGSERGPGVWSNRPGSRNPPPSPEAMPSLVISSGTQLLAAAFTNQAWTPSHGTCLGIMRPAPRPLEGAAIARGHLANAWEWCADGPRAG